MDEKVLIMSHNKLCPLTGQKANAKLYNVEHHMGENIINLSKPERFTNPSQGIRKSWPRFSVPSSLANGNGTVGKQRISSQGNPRKEPQK
ncbi:MAG: hypothetical protein R2867_02275 [Caldilineaceae bacterium]